jgi:hypothetical protein
MSAKVAPARLYGSSSIFSLMYRHNIAQAWKPRLKPPACSTHGLHPMVL